MLALAHEPSARVPDLTKAPRDARPAALNPTVIAFAIRWVARHLGEATLTPQRYDEGRRALIKTRRRTPSGDSYLRRALPSADRIITAVGSWPQALVLAGLEMPTPVEVIQGGLPVPDAIALHFAQTGELPGGRKQLSTFARQSGFSLQSMRGKTWPDWLQLGRERVAQFPELPAPKD